MRRWGATLNGMITQGQDGGSFAELQGRHLFCLLVFFLVLRLILNMCIVHYYLLGTWYELSFADLASARAFACDFIAYYIITPNGTFYES